jgi:hypothetical protein
MKVRQSFGATFFFGVAPSPSPCDAACRSLYKERQHPATIEGRKQTASRCDRRKETTSASCCDRRKERTTFTSARPYVAFVLDFLHVVVSAGPSSPSRRPPRHTPLSSSGTCRRPPRLLRATPIESITRPRPLPRSTVANNAASCSRRSCSGDPTSPDTAASTNAHRRPDAPPLDRSPGVPIPACCAKLSTEP